jgi:hypothetical protein
MDILKKTLEEMPLIFSSNEFSKQAKKNGLTQREINNGMIANYLSHKAKKGNSIRMWEKKRSHHNTNAFREPVAAQSDLDNAVALIKSLGGKVLMPISEYKEL